ncbi:16S rRNA (guanine(1207)-N(2))-methyltransferase RsmC [Psychromonas antarctica]|uniref:16S rRNA (guanine(1207)-N(2))-methyltransferase RsmC n=1 Tax=Psychromonas antarctica TaxID=67573 RepID=UPI001EE7A9D3|nr:16S rRNA (guanine(1207)-N(2))-methyltransferase RsmC [Psychromonas antarctica]MCG6200989.1 16S rRNA (guanine(1207)-N(2))-methyltransferase RsmC [Psychromonas antarctica]
MSLTKQIYSNPSQLLQRNEALFANKNILVAGNIDDDYPMQLEKLALSSIFCFSDYRYYRALSTKLTASELHFTAHYQGEKKFDLLLIFLPKAKKETQYLLASLIPHLQQGASIILVGEKKCGIKSADALLKPYSSAVNNIDSARHCTLLYSELDQTVQPFDQTSWIKTYPINIDNIALQICSLPGVFSYGELDKGSELLLLNLPEKLSGSVLDFGCGAGVIACYIQKKHPHVEIDLVDINVYALESAKLSLIKNQLKGNVFPSDVFSEVHKKYNTLLSNPPFHSGKQTDYVAAETFINQSAQHLKEQGTLSLVANKFLKYEPLLNKVFPVLLKTDENNKFKILTCIKKL